MERGNKADTDLKIGCTLRLQRDFHTSIEIGRFVRTSLLKTMTTAADMTQPERGLEAIYNFEPLADWLGTSGQPTAAQFQDIAAAGYSAVINLALPSSENAISNEGSIVTGHGMAYFHIPVVFERPTVADVRLFFGVMKALEGNRVWAHCVVNARVSAFAYLYLRHALGLDDEAAKTRLLRKWLPQMDDVWRKFLSMPKDLILDGP